MIISNVSFPGCSCGCSDSSARISQISFLYLSLSERNEPRSRDSERSRAGADFCAPCPHCFFAIVHEFAARLEFIQLPVGMMVACLIGCGSSEEKDERDEQDVQTVKPISFWIGVGK